VSSRRKPRRESAPDANVSVVDAELPPAEPQSAPPQNDDDALVRAAAATHHAENLHRQANSVHHHIEALPISAHKKALLHQYPIVMTDHRVHERFKHHYQDGLNKGLPDDSPELDQHIVNGVTADIEAHHAEHRGVEHHAAELSREAAEHLPAAEPPQKRRSMPVSAPVSRDGYGFSGHRPSDSTKITLSPGEREIAAISFPHLSKTEAELAYARNKKLMIQRKANGEIQGDG
jgi:hypothetical protein